MLSIDLTVLSIAVPALSRDLEPSGTQLLWIIDVYGLVLAGSLLLMGSLGDRIGRRLLLLVGAAAFGAASVLAAFSGSAEVLIAARAIMGLAGATLMPSTLALIRNIFHDPLQRRTAVAIWTSCFAAGMGLGPLLGGALLAHFAWGALFLINVPIMVLLLIAGPFLLPESKNPDPGPFDVLSAVLVTTGLVAVVYGFKTAATNSWQDGSWIGIAVGFVVLAAVLLRLLRAQNPLIDVRLFRAAPFTTSVLANALGVFAQTSLLFFFPQYVQVVLEKSPLEAGLWALPVAVGSLLGALSAPLFARVIPVPWIVGGGFALAAAGFVAMSMLGTSAILGIAVFGGFFLGVGVGVADPLTNDVILGSVPPHKAGAAAGIGETGYEVGGALGIATLGAVGMSLYRDNLTSSAPEGMSADAVDAASETLGASQIVADSLPEEIGAGFQAMANEAFTAAMSDVFLIGAAIMAATAVAATIVLRRTMR
nr:MFS transporter [Microbacterium amylolyticum]